MPPSVEATVQGVIFDIKRFAIHDGPGIRTTVFLKGCPLHCLWCQNPEGMSRGAQLIFSPQRCIGCGHCTEVCPQGVHQLIDGQHLVRWERCAACGACARDCYARALQLAGRQVTVGEVMAEVLRDRIFYQTSGGGMTLSGGEPLAQPKFSGALMRAAKAEGLHTALDTSGFGSWRHLERLLPYVDLVLYDVKHMDRERHVALTGLPNDTILSNLRRLDATGRPIWIRIPLIPGHNDDDANLRSLGGFLADLKHIERIEVLRYHRLGESKYEGIGCVYPLRGLEPPSRAWGESRRQILLDCGLPPTVVRIQ